MNKKLTLILAATLGLAATSQAETIIYSNDGGSSFEEKGGSTGTVSIPDPTGSGKGNVIGVTADFVAGNFINVNIGLIDLSQFDGEEWTLTYEWYSPEDLDDNLYNTPNGAYAGAGGNFTPLDGQKTWETVTVTGTITASINNGLGNVLFNSNTQGTVDKTGEYRYYLDNITLTVPVTITPPTTWAGYPINEDGRSVDTGTFIGWIDIGDDPWIWIYAVNSYVYAPEDFISESGGWMWFGQ